MPNSSAFSWNIDISSYGTRPGTGRTLGSTSVPGISFHLFLPQMRLSLDAIVERARAAEAAGFEGIALMDHLVPPMADQHPMYEAMTTATWIAAHTERLTIGHLVLCDAMREAPVLAKQAVTLDHASGGRFELGLGWGSVPQELVDFGVTTDGPKARAVRMAETLTTLRECWAGRQQPTPLTRIPIVIGGSGPRTLAMVAEHADWWNVQINLLDHLEERRAAAGNARVSVQLMVALVPSEAERAAVTELAHRRFGRMGGGMAIGTAPELIEQLGAWGERGVERVYTWFADFAPPRTLEAFGADVIPALR
jgi:alkanesulfonate monooxygenase SsuD/methylene tetrahydromethanopterin reductase-like flavin-dependent oxidoreductase (luciferase family)